MTFDELLETAITQKASDIFVKEGTVPRLRCDGELISLEGEPWTSDAVQAVLDNILDTRTRRIFEEHREVDCAFEIPGGTRFRVNAFSQRGRLAMVLRLVANTVPDFSNLDLPEDALLKLAELRRGLILVTGVTGSGKSTTLAALVQHINQRHSRHIVTLEDPIEFVFSEDQATINQREIGIDSADFSNALRHVVRQSPDVILVGEMRDAETMSAALAAAETGHLVISTLHTVNATQTVERILQFFPPHQHESVRMQLSMVLGGVVAQRLLKRKDGGRVPAVEVMMMTPTVRELLLEGRTHALPDAISEGQHYFCQSFNQSLAGLIENGHVDKDEALAASDDPEALTLILRGITRGGVSADYDAG